MWWVVRAGVNRTTLVLRAGGMYVPFSSKVVAPLALLKNRVFLYNSRCGYSIIDDCRGLSSLDVSTCMYNLSGMMWLLIESASECIIFVCCVPVLSYWDALNVVFALP